MPDEFTRTGRDAAIARIAARQHGVVTSRQLLIAGVSRSAISDRLSAGRLHRVHRGVYAVGHPNIGNEGRWMAAVLACGKGAVVSHASAAELWTMLPLREAEAREDLPVTHVTLSGEGKSRVGIRVHRSSTLSPAQCTRRDAIPVTKPARTLDDLRRVLPGQQFAAVLRQAEFLGLPIGNRFAPDHTRSELEGRFLALLRRHRLPQPEANVRVGGFVVDFLWRTEQLIAELDGWQAHRTRSAFETDRARDNRLRVLGFNVVRFTWRRVADEPAAVARTIRSLLTALW
jgi:very-short-patch-repair endonuclease